MNKTKRIGRQLLCLVVALVMVLTLIPRMPAGLAYAAAGDTPPHTKNVIDNQDGTFTISLDIVGESEKKPNNVNVIVIMDTSGSMTTQRMNAAKNAVNSLANSLYAYNTSDEPDTVEMALVRFATSSSVAQQPTNNTNTFRGAVNGLPNSGNGGTNWEAALQTAYNVDFGDEDQTFVVFVSDGNPTFRTTQNGWNDWSYQYQQYGTGQETQQNITRCYTTAVDDAQALATKVTPANFFTIGAFGNVDRMEQLTDDAGSDSSTNYYSAQDTAALNQAIADILAKIEMAGFADAEIDDGTTNQVETTSGDIAELLELVPNFQYYRSGGEYGTMQPWSDAPEAKIENGEVVWDLSEVGVLENGVRYTVTFDCYPSQYTYDTIAQLRNGDIEYSELDPEIQKYIVDNGGGSYSLRTNTNAGIKWDDTRDDEGRQNSSYTNPDPVKTDSSTLTATKTWEGGEADVDELEITVLMDGEPFHTATISKDSDPAWSTSSFISPGIIKNGEVLKGAEGHDFEFAELGDEQYHWEIDSPVVHPMLIDGELTMLVMVDDTHEAPSGAQTFTIGDNTYYVDDESAGLTATNHRRSNLNIKKVVTGEDAPEDATFPFELSVTNPKAPASEPTDDPDHNSDYWLWFSIYDTNAGKTVMDAEVSGTGLVGPDADGYYYLPSKNTVTVEMMDGWNLRFLNLPTGTTYTFTEEVAEGFAFGSAELTEGEDEDFIGGETTTGTIVETKTSYSVVYTNNYALTDLEITKVWEDGENQDGLRPTAEEFADMLTLSPAVEGKTATVVDNGDDTYTITYTGLPRYSNGEEVTYTVTEGTVEGYTTEEATVEDHGTITNEHTPEVIDVTVKKVWDDADNQDGIRPTSLVVTLSNGDTVTLNESNKWEGKITGLPKFADGEEIEYLWTEADVEGYELTSNVTEGTVTTLTNTHEPEQTEASVEKVWDDADDQDGMRPETLTVKLLADGEDTGKSVTLSEENNWTDTLDELDKYAAGKEITYTWDEGDIENYTLSKTEKDGTVTTLTNTHTPEMVVVEVEKVWDDADNQDGLRPDSVTIKLLADGEDTGKTVTLNEGNEWKAKFEDLDKYAKGEEIKYTVEETEVEGYEADVTGNASSDAEDAPIGYIVTNVHEPETLDITVEKVWEDADDQDGYRPDSITVSLLADGEDTGKTVSLSEANDWTNTFEGLYKYAVGKEGVEVVYTIDESDVPEEYTVAISGTVKDGFTVTNSHELEVVEVSVEKTWDDADDRDGIRPNSVTVTLLADGEEVDQEGITATVELNEKNGWKYTWTDLYKNAEGEEISYTVEEAEVEGYEAVITGDAENGYNIKNFHLAKPAKVMSDPPVKKVVKGNPSTAETFTFQMKAMTEGAPMPAGAKDGVLTMDITGAGEKEFGEMWFDKAGTYVYEISEVDTKAANYKYDSTVYTLTVDVKEVKDGTQVKLVKTETVEGGDGQIVFTNEYKEPEVKTGDTTIVMPYVVIGASALVLLLMLLFRTRKNRA